MALKIGQLVTVIKSNDSLYNIVGKVIEISNDEVTLDLRYIKRTYKISEVKPIVEGKAR